MAITTCLVSNERVPADCARVLYFLAGPTASGKSALALQWAERHGAEILSCDALQVYRGMDIGTAKPSTAERARVPHHGLDRVEPSETFSVAAYLREARKVVAEVAARNRPLVVTGGSGFYLKAFFEPVHDSVRVPKAVRREVERLEAQGGPTALANALGKANPEVDSLEAWVDLRNPRRVANALARCLASGLSLPALREAFERQSPPFPDHGKHLVVIERDRDDLARRIHQRTLAMLEAGLIEEVRRLRQAGFESNPSAATAIGYRETLDFLDGRIENLDTLAEAISRATLRLAKKQRTWLRHQLPTDRTMLNPASDRSLPELCFPETGAG